MSLGIELGFGPGDFVLDGDPAPLPKKGQSPPNFRPMFIEPKGWMDQDGTWHEGRPQPRQLCVRWGLRTPPQFSAQFYCGQTAGCIKMPLGTEVGLSPGNFVLDGDPARPKKGRSPHLQFSAHYYSGQTAGGCIKMPLVLDGDPAPPQNGGVAPNFRPTTIAAKRLHGSRCHLIRR